MSQLLPLGWTASGFLIFRKINWCQFPNSQNSPVVHPGELASQNCLSPAGFCFLYLSQWSAARAEPLSLQNGFHSCTGKQWLRVRWLQGGLWCGWCPGKWESQMLQLVSRLCVSPGQARAQVELPSGPNEFNSVAGHFFFPLIQHFDR